MRLVFLFRVLHGITILFSKSKRGLSGGYDSSSCKYSLEVCGGQWSGQVDLEHGRGNWCVHGSDPFKKKGILLIISRVILANQNPNLKKRNQA